MIISNILLYNHHFQQVVTSGPFLTFLLHNYAELACECLLRDFLAHLTPSIKHSDVSQINTHPISEDYSSCRAQLLVRSDAQQHLPKGIRSSHFPSHISQNTCLGASPSSAHHTLAGHHICVCYTTSMKSI